MALKRSIALSLPCALLLSLTSCSFNPFTTNNELTGSGVGAGIGAGVGAGSAALLGAQKSVIALAGIGGAALGYYVTTIDYASGGVVKAGGQVYTLGDYTTIEIPTDSIFEENSSDLLPEAKPALESAAAVLARTPNSNIVVSGNTSGYGTRRWEFKLSEARAREVAAFLWAHGISSLVSSGPSFGTRKLTYVGYGNYFPISNNIKSESIRQNSRIQITAYPSYKEWQLCKDQKIFGNIGALTEDPPVTSSTSSYNSAATDAQTTSGGSVEKQAGFEYKDNAFAPTPN